MGSRDADALGLDGPHALRLHQLQRHGVRGARAFARCSSRGLPACPQPQRLSKWFTTLSSKEKSKITKDVSTLVLSRRNRMCNFIEYKDSKVVYRRYASLFFIAGIDSDDNELTALEFIHRYVEQMDKYYGNVCELDIIFSFTKAYYILDELLLAGELQESSKKNVLRCISQQDSLEDMEVSLPVLAYFSTQIPVCRLRLPTPQRRRRRRLRRSSPLPAQAPRPPDPRLSSR